MQMGQLFVIPATEYGIFTVYHLHLPNFPEVTGFDQTARMLELTWKPSALHELYNTRARRQAAQKTGILTCRQPKGITPVAVTPSTLPPQPQLWPTTARPDPASASRTRPLADFLPATRTGPQGRKLTAIMVAAPDMPLDLSIQYDWSKVDCISSTLHSLMPGDWPRGDFITNLRRHASLSPDPHHPTLGFSGSIPDWAIIVLLEQADFAFPNVVDLSHGHDSIGSLWDNMF